MVFAIFEEYYQALTVWWLLISWPFLIYLAESAAITIQGIVAGFWSVFYKFWTFLRLILLIPSPNPVGYTVTLNLTGNHWPVELLCFNWQNLPMLPSYINLETSANFWSVYHQFWGFFSLILLDLWFHLWGLLSYPTGWWLLISWALLSHLAKSSTGTILYKPWNFNHFLVSLLEILQVLQSDTFVSSV